MSNDPFKIHQASARRVADLYDRSRIALVFLLALMPVLRWAVDMAYVADAGVRVTFALLVVLTLVRWIVAVCPRHHLNRMLGIRTQLWLFVAGVMLSSLLFAALVILTWPLLDTSRIMILAMILSGLLSGAVTSLGFMPLLYILYLTPPVGALFIMALQDTRPDWGADILATSFILYIVSMALISSDHYRMRKRADELSDRLSALVVRDTLTGLYNRRFLHEFMAVETARIARDTTDIEYGRQPKHDAAVGVYVIDVDFFKQINDTYGHGTGDEVLKQAAVVLSKTLRNSDVVVRWGGEEFVAVARIKHRQNSLIIAEKLRSAIESLVPDVPENQTIRINCSVGFCVIPFFPEQPRLLDWEQALSIADSALYLAKQEGRNRWIGVLYGKIDPSDTQHPPHSITRNIQKAADLGLVSIERQKPASAHNDGDHRSAPA